ncbi:PQQ-binding-like beta-propeller repeat protein [Halobacteriovorax sp. HFRX-2_2]|uniref:outer membrane protein assembly factor BamB family protein n=1 Tax=unclassified Halobacteriovorax TaxID=2639665 RepID=UPI00371A6077
MIKILTATTVAILLTSCSTLNSVTTKLSADKLEKKPLTLAWAKNLEPSYESGNLPISLASPLIHDGQLFAADGRGHFNAYNVETGRLLWTLNIKGQMTSAPIVYENLLIFGDNTGRVYAYDFNKGELAYEFDLDAGVDSTPVVHNGRLFVHTRNHKLFNIDAYTGRVIWSYKRSVPYYSTVQRTSTALISGNKVYAGFADGYFICFSLEEGQVLWERRMSAGQKFVDVDMRPTIFNSKLVVGSVDDKMEVIDLKSGVLYKKLAFQSNRKGVLVDGGKLAAFGSVNGEVIYIDSSFNEVKRIKVDELAVSSLAVWKDGLVVTTVGKTVYYIDSRGQITQRFDLGSAYSAVFGSMTQDEDFIAFISSRFRLYTFK